MARACPLSSSVWRRSVGRTCTSTAAVSRAAFSFFASSRASFPRCAVCMSVAARSVRGDMGRPSSSNCSSTSGSRDTTGLAAAGFEPGRADAGRAGLAGLPDASAIVALIALEGRGGVLVSRSAPEAQREGRSSRMALQRVGRGAIWLAAGYRRKCLVQSSPVRAAPSAARRAVAAASRWCARAGGRSCPAAARASSVRRGAPRQVADAATLPRRSPPPERCLQTGSPSWARRAVPG